MEEKIKRTLIDDPDRAGDMITELAEQSPEGIIAMIRPDQDEDVLLAVIDSLSWDDDMVDNEYYLQHLLPMTAHANPDIRYYTHETLAHSGKEEYYPLVKEYVCSVPPNGRLGGSVSFLRPFIDRHEDEIVEIICKVIDEGNLYTKYYAYQSLAWCESKRAKEKMKEVRQMKENKNFQLSLRKFSGFFRDIKKDLDEMQGGNDVFRGKFLKRKIVPEFPTWTEYL